MTFTDEQLEIIGHNFIQNFDTDCCVVGGSILSTLRGFYPKDIDICFYSREDRDAAVKKAKSLNYRIYTAAPISIRMEAKEFSAETSIGKANESKAGTVHRPRFIDLVTGLGNSMESILEKHGFSIMSIAVDKGGTVKIHEKFEEDLENGIIRVVGDHPNKFHPNRARVLMKYLAKGFTIDNTEFAKYIPGKPDNITSTEDVMDWLADFIVGYGMNNNKK